MANPSDLQPPPGRRSAPRGAARVVYAVDGLPAYDAAFYDAARAGMAKVGEMIVPPREAARVRRSGGAFLPHRQHRGAAGRRPQSVECARSAERFFSGKTRALHATHVSTGDRLWSTLPTSADGDDHP